MKINFSSLKVYVNTEIQKLYNVFSPILHSHGNITSNGMIGDSNDNANKNVVTDENGQITIEEKTEGLDSFNYGYIDENLQCHLIKVEEINILSADSQLLPSEDFNLSGEIITDDETNNPIAVKIYLNNDYLETIYTYGYDKSFDFSIEDSELVSGENIIKMQCGNVVLEHTCLLSQDVLTLTSDKDILSYADNDAATLTATLFANDNVGKEVVFSTDVLKSTVVSESGTYNFGNKFVFDCSFLSAINEEELWLNKNGMYIHIYPQNTGKIGITVMNSSNSIKQLGGTDGTFTIENGFIKGHGLDDDFSWDISNVDLTDWTLSSGISVTVDEYFYRIATTDSSGVAIAPYISRGAGDVTITAECMSLQETITIQDYYISSSTDFHFTGASSDTRKYTHPFPNFTFSNTSWEMTAEMKCTHNGEGFGVSNFDNTKQVWCVKQGNNYYLSGLEGTNPNLWERSNVLMNTTTYYPIKITKEGDVLKWYFNDVLMKTMSSTDFANVSTVTVSGMSYYASSNFYVRNIKVKPL